MQPFHKIKTEVHLMIENPMKYIELFAECGVDIIYVHPESEYNVITTLQKIGEMGMEAGIVLNPGTAVSTIIELLNVVERVLVMGVIRVRQARCTFHMQKIKLKSC